MAKSAKSAKSHVHDVIAHGPDLPLGRHVQEAGLANVRFTGDHLALVTTKGGRGEPGCSHSYMYISIMDIRMDA